MSQTNAREIGKEQRHQWRKCGHTVQQHGCLRPPKWREESAIESSLNDIVVYYFGLCNQCEYNNLVRTAVGDTAQVDRVLKDYRHIEITKPSHRVKYPNQMVMGLICKKDKNDVDSVIFHAGLIRRDGDWHLTIPGTDVTNKPLSILEKLKAYEWRWSERTEPEPPRRRERRERRESPRFDELYWPTEITEIPEAEIPLELREIF